MLNHIDIMGRLVRDPELRTTPNQIQVCSFTIACDDDRAGKDGERKAIFIDCVAWRHTAEFVSKYFPKGSTAIVSGRLQIREWEKEGVKHRSPEILVENIYFGQKAKGADSTVPGYDPEGPVKETQVEFSELFDDDAQLPF